MIKTTFSGHHKCFVCNRKHTPKNRLKNIRKESVVESFKKYSIFIKKDSRCCKKHLDNDGLLKKQIYETLRIKYEYFDPQTFKIINELYEKEKSIFEKFEDIDSLEEYECVKITGWTKENFVRFSKFISSINNTDGRTKEQLIALYRYWLRKGLDQSSLALLFGKNTSQIQISQYLSQIREAIYKDFVPYFLGCNKQREFFLNHNNEMVKHLFDLKPDDLVIVLDGTYTRLEKSANNQFQYSCWSSQKKDLLVKPFIICCADGYFVDCYGPFEAFENDAKIFKYIIENDSDLKRLLLPYKTIIFLDRGNFIFVKIKKTVFKFLKQGFEIL